MRLRGAVDIVGPMVGVVSGSENPTACVSETSKANPSLLVSHYLADWFTLVATDARKSRITVLAKGRFTSINTANMYDLQLRHQNPQPSYQYSDEHLVALASKAPALDYGMTVLPPKP